MEEELTLAGRFSIESLTAWTSIATALGRCFFDLLTFFCQFPARRLDRRRGEWCFPVLGFLIKKLSKFKYLNNSLSQKFAHRI